MKKLVSFALVFLFLFSTAYASEIDWASMTDEELHTALDEIRNEITNRSLLAENMAVLFESNGVTVYLTGENEIGWMGLEMGVIIVNDSDKKVSIQIEDVYINGWAVDSFGISDTAPGKKQKGEFTIYELEDAFVTDIKDIEDIEITFYIFDNDNFKRIATLDPITIVLPE